MKLPAVLVPLRAALDPIETEPPPGTLRVTVDRMTGARHSAVLVLLFPRGEDVSFFLTIRPHTLARHAGQIALPGGAAEPADRSLWETALRETHEELGVRTGSLRPLGRLASIHVAASNYVIAPYVAWSPAVPAVNPDPGEVAEVFEVPIRALLNPASVLEERWELRGRPVYVCYFHLADRIVWGATARILADLARRLGHPAFEPPLIPGSVRPA
ncbi:MAG: CoA pyrophosphatase [Chloroflexi bacterium]|nr:CoA pyrophosphatase [Chloroflexota bacterium]